MLATVAACSPESVLAPSPLARNNDVRTCDSSANPISSCADRSIDGDWIPGRNFAASRRFDRTGVQRGQADGRDDRQTRLVTRHAARPSTARGAGGGRQRMAGDGGGRPGRRTGASHLVRCATSPRLHTPAGSRSTTADRHFRRCRRFDGLGRLLQDELDRDNAQAAAGPPDLDKPGRPPTPRPPAPRCSPKNAKTRDQASSVAASL